MFKITDFVEFDSKNRAICPACTLSKGTGYRAKNLSLVVEGGAYKCHRGCTPTEIREALGEGKDRIIPTALATPPKKVTVTPKAIKDATEALLKSKEPLQWLLSRGFSREDIQKYRLGLVRSKCGRVDGKDIFLPAIGIPIRADADGTQYYQKKRVAPWLPEEEQPDGYKAWSQYGIPPMVYFTHKPDTATETWLCEGEWDAMMMGLEIMASGKKETIAVACFTSGAGNVPNQEQLDRLPGKVIIWYDLDEPGTLGALKAQDRMRERAFIGTIPAPTDAVTGWDVSDALREYTIDRFTPQAAKPWTEPKKENPLRSRFLTNDEMIGNAQDHVEWLVPDIFTPDELFIIGMPPRGGKSIFCLTLAKSVAIGGTFLDRPVTQGSVIYVNLEDAPTKVKQRQIAQGWSEGLPVYWLDKFKLSELDSLKELADEIPDLRLVILDTFSRVRDDGQKESSAELGKTLEPLQEWAKDRGICILLTHHTGKVGSDGPTADPFEMLRGSTSIRATCRGALVIVPGESSYRLLAENGYADRLDVSVRINPETLEWKLLGNWTPKIDGDMKTQILDHLNLIGSSTVTDIAKALRFNATSVGTTLSRLHRDELVSKVGGSGRQPATYSRSFNLLKQQVLEFKQPNVDTAYDTDLLKQETLCGVPSEKVINEVESDHSNDHFSQNAPTHTGLFKQSGNPDSDGAVCFNAPSTALKQIEATEAISVGSQVRYKRGKKNTLMGRVCRDSLLEVLAIYPVDGEGDYCTVASEDWTQTQSVPLKDLRLT